MNVKNISALRTKAKAERGYGIKRRIFMREACLTVSKIRFILNKSKVCKNFNRASLLREKILTHADFSP
ncbi:MAG: hypothetical protein Q4G48_04045, partial [Bacteroidia bacterium]|nr:hypothetical protein [Bacteroidia bacterium]